MKTCTRCGIEKPLDEFNKSKNRKDGYQYECKYCKSERFKKWRLENIERKKAYNKKWNLENPEKSKSYIKKWKLENTEKVIESNKKWNLENQEKVKTYLKKWNSENTERKKYYNKKWRLENQDKIYYIEQKRILKKQIGETPPPELVEVKLLINKTKRLCKTLKN
jgi:DNA-directed RNA polymerase subunit RPC12/RpoP